MRWTLLSLAAAVALIMLGFFAIGADNMNIAEKTTYWLCVTAFVSAEALHFTTWIRRRDL